MDTRSNSHSPTQPVAQLVLAQCRHGHFLFFPHDYYIGGGLATYGEYSEAEVEFLKRMLHPGDVVIDAGANIGCLTVPLARAVGPSGRVFAFEPQRIIFQILCANVAINGLWNVITKQEAASNDYLAIGVPAIDYAALGNFGDVELVRESDEMVRSERIDDLDLPRCRLIKIDVQGMEGWVLEGAIDTIKRCRPFLYVEDENEGKDLPTAMRDLGYDVYWHKPPLFNPDNFRKVDHNEYPNVVSFNLVGVPREIRDKVVVDLEAA